MQIFVRRVGKLRMHNSLLQKEEQDVYWVWIYRENWGYIHLRNQPLSIDPGLTCYCASSQKV